MLLGRRLLQVVTAVVLLVPSARAQAPAALVGCYRFDRPYFSWVGRRPGDSHVYTDTSSVIRLFATTLVPHDMVRGNALDLEPQPFRADSTTRRRWLRASGWVATSDSMMLSWRNGLYGPVFLLAIRGDTLRGRVRFTTDVVGREPPPEAATAVRVPCEREP